MNPRLLRVAVVGIIALGLIGLFLAKNPLSHRFVVKAYFSDGMGLREGAAVRLAGIDVGSVRSIGLRADRKVPVEVVMVLNPKFATNIPNDSTAELSTAGILGQTYVSIDAANASGAPLQTNGVLTTKPTIELSTPELIDKVMEDLRKNCPCLTDPNAAKVAAKSVVVVSQPPTSKR